MEEQHKLKYKIKLPPVAFLVCLIITCIGWIVINFSKEYKLTLSYQLVCSDIPTGKQFVAQSDSVLQISFNAKGVNYLTSRYSDKNRVVDLSLSTITRNMPKRNVYTFNKRALADYLREQGVVDQDFVEIVTPESVTIYLK